MKTKTAAITAVGGYVPEDVLTNETLATMVDTSDEWIMTRVGIKERRILRDETKATSDLCVPVVLQLCEKRGILPSEIDVIIVATATPDMLMPSTATILIGKVGATKAWGVDVNAACTGFLAALEMGAAMVAAGRYKKVIVIGADKMSAMIDYTDRATCTIFGDGAGGVLLEPSYQGFGLRDSILECEPSGQQHLQIRAGGSLRPASIETINNKEHFMMMNGGTIFKQAVSLMSNVVQEVMDRNELTVDNLNWLVPHQANQRIISSVGNSLGLPLNKIMLNIERYGNTTAATIPLCLWDYEDQIYPGDNLILTAFGAGFIWGGAYVKWGADE
ncbi:3-oxoacyl-[acyl-carrier-protein] synthase-3 [Chitinophaga skermanii]|uniref:Beta-ketoacyl-[acyl-carrier-protein] synthase III n=1 Tax=Chitinophaga skermanii TaxID=331697 RepID=A0A327QBJ7_9BACT|nr:beta-ketoacyl-ACP synthase III [Chitinophaga skermanii]RAJ01661.1 3-oxoacyl-[acyl-carrier-protein] synthase-3 [Chitinophaga skermanii]